MGTSYSSNDEKRLVPTTTKGRNKVTIPPFETIQETQFEYGEMVIKQQFFCKEVNKQTREVVFESFGHMFVGELCWLILQYMAEVTFSHRTCLTRHPSDPPWCRITRLDLELFEESKHQKWLSVFSKDLRLICRAMHWTTRPPVPDFDAKLIRMTPFPNQIKILFAQAQPLLIMSFETFGDFLDQVNSHCVHLPQVLGWGGLTEMHFVIHSPS